MKITIFTPTYNRAHTLQKLYESLIMQTNQNFEWLIIDDGSTDDTKLLVDSFINRESIKIKYEYQENKGKMQAHNHALKICRTEYILCVDSDDYLVKRSIEEIYNAIELISKDDSLSGAIFYRGKNDKEVIGTKFPEYTNKLPLFKLYETGFKGDTSLLYKTKILQKYPFPFIEGEKFIPEEYIYRQIDEVYEMYLVPKILIVTEYLSDGYTNNIRSIVTKNPKGWALYYLKKSEYESKFILILKYIRIYITLSLLAKNKNIINSNKRKILTILIYPISYFWYLIKYRK